MQRGSTGQGLPEPLDQLVPKGENCHTEFFGMSVCCGCLAHLRCWREHPSPTSAPELGLGWDRDVWEHFPLQQVLS